jgi:hypothetical protein
LQLEGVLIIGARAERRLSRARRTKGRTREVGRAGESFRRRRVSKSGTANLALLRAGGALTCG